MNFDYLTSRGFRLTEDYYYDETHHSAVFFDDLKNCVIIDIDLCDKGNGTAFDYSKYCEMQNKWMTSSKKLYRFYLADTQNDENELITWLDKDPDSIEVNDKGGSFDKAHIDNTPLEKGFEDLFTEAYGNDSVNYLQKEYSLSLNEGRNAFVDYVLETDHGSFAIEENGVHYHHPQIIGEKQYKRQLEKQNTLLSCQLISEGWDSPQTEVVVMARPTLSKVLYTQQMGRGVRKYPGKECLYVIDVVDNYEGKLSPVCFNSLMQIPVYSDFMGVKNNNQDYLSILGLNETEIAMKEIDIFTFEDKYSDYLSPEQAARELFIGTSSLMSWYRKDNSIASLTLPIGSRQVPYFSKEDVENIRVSHNLGIHDDTTILKDFEDFIDENTLTFSFKLIFMLSMLKLADKEGEVNIDDLINEYRSFYIDRINNKLPVDRSNCVYTKEYLEDDVKTKQSILSNPFEKFERKRFVYYSKDLNILSFNPLLWKQLTPEKKQEIKDKEVQFLKEYYEKIDSRS